METSEDGGRPRPAPANTGMLRETPPCTPPELREAGGDGGLGRAFGEAVPQLYGRKSGDDPQAQSSMCSGIGAEVLRISMACALQGCQGSPY